MKRYLVLIIYGAIFFCSCGFPNKATTKQVNGDLDFLKPLILSEFKSSKSFLPAYQVKSDTLKKYFAKNGITELSIQYTSGDETSKKKGDLLSQDSLITFHINQSKNKQLKYKDIIYCFADQKPKNLLLNLGYTSIKQVNDSLWLAKTHAEVVIVH